MKGIRFNHPFLVFNFPYHGRSLKNASKNKADKSKDLQRRNLTAGPRPVLAVGLQTNKAAARSRAAGDSTRYELFQA